MAQDNKSGVSLLNICEFLLLLLVFFVFSLTAFYRLLFTLGMIHCLLMVHEKSIPVSFGDEQPFYYITGKAAFITGTSMALIFAAMIWFTPELVSSLSEGRNCK